MLALLVLHSNWHAAHALCKNYNIDDFILCKLSDVCNRVLFSYSKSINHNGNTTFLYFSSLMIAMLEDGPLWRDAVWFRMALLIVAFTHSALQGFKKMPLGIRPKSVIQEKKKKKKKPLRQTIHEPKLFEHEALC